MSVVDEGVQIELNMEEGVRLVTVKEARRRIPVSREFLYLAIKSGKIPSYRIGRRILVDVNECLAAMRVQHEI